MKKIALYARVSTDKQTVDNQLIELRSLCERLGYTIVQEYTDSGISGAKSRNDRPALDALMKDATRRRFDMVMCWSLDRLGRSLQSLIQILNELESLKIDLYFHQQALDTSTPSGRLFFSIAASFAEYERNLIVERIRCGQIRAKANGVKLGRPTTINAGTIAAIKILREQGFGVKTIGVRMGVGIGSVYKALNEN